MAHYVIGDVHGCGLELQELLQLISPNDTDVVISVGDLFDRGMHSHLVWDAVRRYNILTLRGNHEAKFMKYMSGEKKDLPLHYFYAAHLLQKHGVPKAKFYNFLQRTKFLHSQFDSNSNPFIVAHAAVNPWNPFQATLDINVYGKLPGWESNYGGTRSAYDIQRKNLAQENAAMADVSWWDQYTHDIRVFYGHAVTTPDTKPRIRRGRNGHVNSVGLDTAAVHDGQLTAVCVESLEVFQVKAKKDWFRETKKQILIDTDFRVEVVREWLLS